MNSGVMQAGLLQFSRKAVVSGRLFVLQSFSIAAGNFINNHEL